MSLEDQETFQRGWGSVCPRACEPQQLATLDLGEATSEMTYRIFAYKSTSHENLVNDFAVKFSILCVLISLGYFEHCMTA